MIDFAVVSDVGERNYNEDSVEVATNIGLKTYGFMVADGLGGHGKGAEASRYAVDYVKAAVEQAKDLPVTFLENCFVGVQNMLLSEQKKRGCPGTMKTTMTILTIDSAKASWGHIGDSRIYLFREGRFVERTRDHSMVQILLDAKKIKERDVRRHPDRNKLLRALGMEWDEPGYEVDRKGLRILKGDAFLLCSDGFWDWIDEKNMVRVLKKAANANETLQEMYNIVVKNGRGHDMDNCSAILVLVK